ncbi:hypothetical protein DFH28DRAFT_965339 [Melampsora americana]|nr:hypothetical protein DFH28DRAFT_965339 [Melampsora americana]
MLSHLILGLSIWMPSHAYAALMPIHTASVIAHDSSEIVPTGAFAHAISPIDWSPGTTTLTERLTDGAQAEERLKIIHDQIQDLHDHLLEDFDREKETKRIPIDAIKSGQLIFRPARKLISEDSSRIALAPSRANIAPSRENITSSTTLVAPSINIMRGYSSEELVHIEEKAKKLKMGFDYT